MREACVLARSTQPAMRAAACRLISAVVLEVHPVMGRRSPTDLDDDRFQLQEVSEHPQGRIVG
jgi:hypothetical protein